MIDSAFLATWRQLNRFQLRFALFCVVVVVGLAVVGVVALGVVDQQFGCIGYTSHASSDGCIGVPAFDVLNRVLEALGFLVIGLPIVVGLLLGVALIGRERQERTLALAFSLEARRGRWLAERFLFAAAATVVVGVVCGVAGFGIAAVRYPGVDLGSTFQAYGQWGLIVPVRGLLALAIGVFVGSLTGRALSALMLSAALALGLLVGSEVFSQRSYPPSLWVANASTPSDRDLRLTNGKVLAPDGSLIEIMDAVAVMPDGLWGVDDAAASAWLAEHYPYADWVIPGASMLAVEFRESALLVILAASLAALSFAAVRRSPVR